MFPFLKPFQHFLLMSGKCFPSGIAIAMKCPCECKLHYMRFQIQVEHEMTLMTMVEESHGDRRLK